MNRAPSEPAAAGVVRRAWSLLLGVSLCLAIVATLLGVGKAEAATRPLITGVTNTYTNEPLAFRRIRASGGRMVRVQLYWGAAAPRSRPASWNPYNPSDPGYNWTESDEAVRNAVAAGLTPVLQVDGAPSWAQRCTVPHSLAGAICDPDPADLRAFAHAAAARYSGRFPGVPAVRYFQALNEPNLSLFFLPQFEVNGNLVSPYLYRELINAFYAGVKAASPNALVLLAGLGPIAVPKYTIGPIQFAKAMLCMTGSKRRPRPLPGDCGGGVSFDIFAIQPYTTGGPSHEGRPNDVQIGDLWKLQRLIRAADDADRIKGAYRRTPLWITEFSWDSKPPDPGGLPMRIATRWVAEALHRAWSAGVTRFFWYTLRDGARHPGQSFSEALESGLYFRGATLAEDRPKPLERAFRFPFVAYPGRKLAVWGRTPNSRRGKVRIQVKSRRGWVTVRTLRADRAGIFEGRISTGYGRDHRGAARAVFAKQRSPAFSMKPVPDFYHPPFG